MATDSENPQTPARKPVRILVAEDSPLNLQVALKQLEKLGYQGDAATDGTQALQALGRIAYDIILMDCQMPEMSGYEATWQIREQEKQQATDPATATRVYIIAMTANTEADNREKCRQAGMDDFIVKPVQLPELEAALHRALADRATQQALEEVIDPIVIAGLRQLRIPGRPDPLAEIIDLFLQEAPKQLDAMRQAIAKNDLNAMARVISAATALKGSAGNLGARNLAALGEEIEQAAKAGFLADAAPVLDKATAEFTRVRDTLGKIKSEATAS
jgi:CheY-like chemotaxis protein/HPt (histidine-containing phosphotransfer) domain-containing protein